MEKNQKSTLSVKTVALNGKESASFLVPDLQENQKLAVVDEKVLNYLTDLLPTADFYSIRRQFRDVIDGCGTLKELVKEAKEFVTFHESVNLLERFFDPKTEIVREEPLNVAQQPKPIEELMVENGFEEEEPGNGTWRRRWNDAFTKMMVDKGYYLSGDNWIKSMEGPLQPVDEVRVVGKVDLSA